jgi:hypothetical protein
MGCAGLTGVTIHGNVTVIGCEAFKDCTGLSSVTIGRNSSTLSIGFQAFSGCTRLTSIIIPNTMLIIEYGAFELCTSLTSVTIPSGIYSFGYGVFADCASLTEINVAPNNYVGLFTENGVLYAKNKDEEILVQYPAGKKDSAFTIPTRITHIDYYAFCGCRSLTDVTIPNGVTMIGQGAFKNTSLTSVTIPASVTSIRPYAFSGCTSLTSVTFQGRIASSVFDDFNPAFPGDLVTKYLAGGIGTYTREKGSNTWTKQ